MFEKSSDRDQDQMKDPALYDEIYNDTKNRGYPEEYARALADSFAGERAARLTRQGDK